TKSWRVLPRPHRTAASRSRWRFRRASSPASISSRPTAPARSDRGRSSFRNESGRRKRSSPEVFPPGSPRGYNPRMKPALLLSLFLAFLQDNKNDLLPGLVGEYFDIGKEIDDFPNLKDMKP